MVRSRRILEIIETDGLIEAAAVKGAHFLTGLQAIADAHSEQVGNARGRGLFLAIDLSDRAVRDRVVADLHDREHVIVLPCGERSIRFRPALSVSNDEIDEAVSAVARAVSRVLGQQSLGQNDLEESSK
jgi:L-lysine 6-transaminase